MTSTCASDPDVGPRAGWPPHQSVEESLELIKTVFSGEGMWAVELKETGKDVLCPNLEVGGDKPVKVMRLDYAI